MGRKNKIMLVSAIVAFVVLVLIVVLLLSRQPGLVRVVIPPGLRKEEIATILASDLHWTGAEEEAFMISSSSPDFSEGVYFPDTYLIPPKESAEAVADRLVSNFNDKFAPYQKQALSKNIKWTTVLNLASIIQREAASSSDMYLISGILWNRLNAKMYLDVDSTVQYARGDAPQGWWAPVTADDLKIDSPYNTYLNKGLPPHPIDNPGLDAIDAALNPRKTDCLYYLHDSSRNIHCSVTYADQQANVDQYLR